MWIWIIIIVAIIGGIWGYFSSDGDAGAATSSGAAGGCIAAGCLGRLALTAISILAILWLFDAIFG